MKKCFKRPVSILLSVLMIMSLFTGVPMTASAADNSNATTAEAVQAVFSAGGNVTLGGDITISNTLTVADGKTVTLNLNGHTISHTANSSNTTKSVISVGANATLTISGSGLIQITNTRTGNSSNDTVHAITVQNGTLNIDGAVIRSGNTGTAPANGIEMNGGTLNLTCGKVQLTGSGTAINALNRCKVNISGGTVHTNNGLCVNVNGGQVIITGGCFQSDNNATLLNKASGSLVLYGGVYNKNISTYVRNPYTYKQPDPGSSIYLVYRNQNRSNLKGYDTFWAVFDENLNNSDNINDYTLYLFGTIKGFDGNSSNIPWQSNGNSFRNKIKRIIAMSGTTTYSDSKKLSYLFYNHGNATYIDLSGLDTSGVTDMSNMFSNCSSLDNLTLRKNFVTSAVTATEGMFSACTKLKTLDVSDWDTRNVTNMSAMFRKMSALTSLDLSKWNTGKVENMSLMFSQSTGLTSLDIKKWNTGSVKNMNSMFSSASGLTSLDLSGWNTGSVTTMNQMFANATGFISLDLSNWDTSKVTNMSSMFSGVSSLNTLYVSDTFAITTNASLSNAETSKYEAGWYNEANLNNKVSGDGNFAVIEHQNGKLVRKKAVQKFTVTWKMDNDSIIDTTRVAINDTPTHADPTKPATAQYTYTFAGWNNGTQTYAPNALPAVTGDTTYKAVFTPVPFIASVTSNGTTTKYTDLSTALTNWTEGSTLTLLDNVSISSAIQVSDTKTLDLNGKTITMTGNDCILYVTDGSLTVNGNGGTLTGGKGGKHYGDGYGRGGAIDLKKGNLILDNCNITGNSASFGSAIFVAQNGSCVLTIQNGTSITNNSGGGAVIWVQGATVNMTGGTISNNNSVAVSLHSQSSYNDIPRFNMSGGTISNNGGGVAFGSNQAGCVTLSGNPVIKDNNSNNLCMSGTAYVEVNGTLGDDASIGIKTSSPGVFTNSTDTSYNDASKFFSDDGNYIFGKNADGQLLLGVPHTVKWNNEDNSLIDTTIVADGGVPTHAEPTKPDTDQYVYPFAGWKNGTTTYAPNATLPAVTGDVTYTATFKQESKYIKCVSLSLAGDIGVNFAIDNYDKNPEDLTVNVAWYKYSYTYDVKDLGSTTSINGKTYYKVTANVAAKEMADTITVTLYEGSNVLETFTYSVREYAKKIIDTEDLSTLCINFIAGKSAQLKDLCKAMLKYGSAAEAQFDPQYPENIPAHTVNGELISASDGVDYTGYTVADIPAYTAPDFNGTFGNYGLQFYATSIGTKSTTNYMIVFKAPEGSNAPTVIYNGESITPKTDQYDGYAVYNIDGIDAKNIPDDIVLTVGGSPFTTNMLEYIHQALSHGDDILKNAVRAFYDYGVKAKAYFA